MTGELDFSGLDPAAVARIRMTVSCRDTDGIPKVAQAGEVLVLGDRPVQMMHNGLLIDEGCYYGPWMTQIIRGLDGHHEPQEEVVFDAIVRFLQRSESPEESTPVIVELGSFWAYYSMWFCRALPGGTALAMEPDPEYLEIGRRNAELNGLSDRITFFRGAVGSHPGTPMSFPAESTGEIVETDQYDLASVMDRGGLSRIDLAMIDIQGAETVLLERARDILTAGAVRFLVISTHHQSISGDPLTHQTALRLLIECGAHIIAEHSVRESYSGDGLIAASFDQSARDLNVAVSHARAKDSLFGEPEYELNHYLHQLAQAGESGEVAEPRVSVLEQQLQDTRSELAAERAELARLRSTRMMRWSKGPRAGYARLRRRLR